MYYWAVETIDFASTARLFHALSDETRLRILDRLRRGDRCVCELTGALDAAQSRLSFHLRTLKDAGLVSDHRAGRWVYYRLRPEAFELLRTVLGRLGTADSPRPSPLPVLAGGCC